MHFFLKYIFFLFFLVFVHGCQLNDTLVQIKENLNLGDQSQTLEEDVNREKKEKVKKKLITQKLDKSKQLNQESFNRERLVLVQPKITREQIEEIKKEKINKIGLLFPLSGKNSDLGKSLINSVRLYLEKGGGELEFKTFDTQSTLEGSIDALEKGISEKIKVFIGPIFSDETSYIKNIAAKNKSLIFSFSTDKKVISKNIIITGISLEDEIACIISNAIESGRKKIGIISNNDPYGNLLVKTLYQLKLYYEDLEISNLKIEKSTNLDDEIKKFSFFEEGKKKLEQEIERVESQLSEEQNKNNILDELSKLETFGDKPYDLLIVGESGSKLIEILALFAFYDIDSSNTNIVGTSIWQGIERFRENILDNTYYATSLENNKDDYNKKFESIFYDKPDSLNYILNDLLGFIEQKFQLVPINEDLSKTFNGEFSSHRVNEEGYFQRNISINRIERGKVEKFYSCPVSSI